MDPLSGAASIVALLQLTGTVIRYLSDVRDGPKELQRIRLEVSTIPSVLIMLQDRADQANQDDSFPSLLRSLDVPHGPFEQFRMALERLESKLAPVEGWRKLSKPFKWTFEKGEIHEILNIIERQKTMFNLALQNDHIALSKALRVDIETIQIGVDNLQVGKNHKKIHRWLSAPDPSSNYNKALRIRHAFTGDWFLKTDTFEDWLSKPGHLVWLHGIPGCGKTILSATIIQRTEDYCQSRSGSVLLYFYFDFNDTEKQLHEKMIRSLIVQLSSQSTRIPHTLESLYESSKNGERQPRYDLLLATLHQMMTYFEETYLVLDALDECLERQELLFCIDELTHWKDANLHILTTSRKEKDIEESIAPFCDECGKICIQSGLVNDDIRMYVHGRLNTDRGLKRWQDKPNIQLEIENTLMDRADGMFRWAACQLDALKPCLNIRELRKALSSLPKTLDDTYSRILCNIEEERNQYAFKVLQWLAYSARPLKLEEVAEVIAINVEEDPRFDPDNRLSEPRDILQICSGLISLEQQKSSDFLFDEDCTVIVRLAHFSVKEYLISERILQGKAKRYSFREIDANILICNDCLAYLLELDSLNSLTPEFPTEFPLAEYAARYWTRHARKAEEDSSFKPLLAIELFLTKGKSSLNSIISKDPDRPWSKSDLQRRLSRFYPPLYYASQAGLYKTVQMLLDKGAEVNAGGGRDGSALQAASVNGHDKVVQMLLEKGANIDAKGGIYGNALYEASSNGHVKVVQMLLEKGADVNAKGGKHGNALQMASSNGHDKVVQMLLEKGANVNAECGEYGSALGAASYGGHKETLQILLKFGATIDLKDMQGRLPIHLACAGGKMETLELLLNVGAGSTTVDTQGRNCLHHAASQGSTEVVEWLLKEGVSPNIADRDGWTPLHWAARNGNADTIAALMSAGAVSTTENIEGWTPDLVAVNHHKEFPSTLDIKTNSEDAISELAPQPKNNPSVTTTKSRDKDDIFSLGA